MVISCDTSVERKLLSCKMALTKHRLSWEDHQHLLHVTRFIMANSASIKGDIVTAQQNPQPHHKNNHKCGWVEAK